MSEKDRAQRWRQRQRDEGREPLTLWLPRDVKLRLEDLAATSRVSPAELVEQALAQFQPGARSVTAPVPDTEQLRLLMQEAPRETTAVTELVTDIVTDTLARDLPTLVRDAMASLGETLVVAPVTDTDSNVAATDLGSQGRARGEIRDAVLMVLADHQPATPTQVAQVLGDSTKAGIKRVWQSLQRLRGSGKVLREGKQYRLAVSSP